MWGNLGQPVTIYTDLGNNGTIDDTIFVGNTVHVDAPATVGIPKEYSVSQNYPNPFNPSTRIKYTLPAPGRVSIKVYNLLGQEVASLFDEEQIGGSHTVEWNGTATGGNNVSSGVYFYRLEADGFVQTKKLMLLR